MPESKIIGYKRMFGFVLPDWIDERLIRLSGSALLSVAVMFFVLIFFVWPNNDLIRSKSTSLKEMKESLSALKSSKSGIDTLSSALSPKELDTLLNAIPQDYSPEAAIYMLRRISSDTGVSITAYSLPSGTLMDAVTVDTTGTTKKVAGDMVEFSTFPIKLTVTASVDSLLNFVSKIESSIPFGVVSDLNLQEVTKLSTTQINKPVQLALEINFYRSRLRSVNLNKVQPFTSEEIALAKELSKYEVLQTQELPNGLDTGITGSGNIFGF